MIGLTHADCDEVARLLRKEVASCNECATVAQTHGDEAAELRFAREARKLSALLVRVDRARPDKIGPQTAPRPTRP